MADGLIFQVNGAPATVADLSHLALVNYGCFTVMPVEVEDGVRGVRGLDLHLDRLEVGAVEMFGRAVPRDRLRDLMGAALVGRGGPASLRVNLFSRALTVREPSAEVEPDVLVTVGPLGAAPTSPLSLDLVRYARETPHLKHVATYGLIRERRAARAAGFDDALFISDDGVISEGATWNIGFLAGDAVVWPSAPMLAGTGQALLQRGLDRLSLPTSVRPIRAEALASFDGAVIVNASTAARPVSRIGETAFRLDADRIAALIAAYRSNPLEPL